MEYIKIKEIVDIYLGLTHTPKYIDEGIPFLSVKNISKGKIDFSKCHYISSEEYEKLPQGAKPKKGDMIFCRVGTIGKPLIIGENIEKFGSFVSLGFFRNKNSDYLLEYLKYWMDSNLFYKQVKKNVKGVAQVNLNTTWLKEFVIPKRSIEEQKQIVSRLNKIQRLINVNQEQIDLSDELIKSKFRNMFGTLENNNWKKERLENLTLKITDGKHGGCKKEENSGYYFVGATEIYDDKINYKEANQITKEDFERDYSRCNLMLEDFVIVNTGATIGKSAIVENDVCERILLQKSVALIRTKKEKIMPIYLKYCYKNNKSLYSKGQGCARINLLLKQIRNTIIPVPPIELQNQFAEIVKQVDKQKEKYQEHLNKAQELMNALMKKYFN